MSQPASESDTEPSTRARAARRLALGLAVACSLFWAYSFVFIARLPPGDGSGFQWLAEVPLTAIMVLFVVPAWLLVALNRMPRTAAALGVVGLAAFAIVWMQLLGEFPKR